MPIETIKWACSVCNRAYGHREEAHECEKLHDTSSFTLDKCMGVKDNWPEYLEVSSIYRGMSAVYALCYETKERLSDFNKEASCPWEYEAKKELRETMRQARVVDSGVVEVPCDQPECSEVHCSSAEEIWSALDDIGSNAWNSCVPRDGGEAVWEWHEVSYDYIQAALEVRPDICKTLGIE